MTTDADNMHDVVRVYAGSVVTAELYQQALRDAGIDSKVVGQELDASFGSALLNSVELWVKSEDAEKAQATLKQFEDEKVIAS